MSLQWLIALSATVAELQCLGILRSDDGNHDDGVIGRENQEMLPSDNCDLARFTGLTRAPDCRTLHARRRDVRDEAASP